jgi:hypothetical protein
MISLMTAISTPVQTVLDLFATSLADVRFGDVDAQGLARVASEVESSAALVASAQASLDSARVALHERQEALLQLVQRALAYARVYAEADEALSARLDAVTLPRATRRPRSEANDALVLTADPQPSPRPRGRPRKIAPLVATPEVDRPMLEGLASNAE